MDSHKAALSDSCFSMRSSIMVLRILLSSKMATIVIRLMTRLVILFSLLVHSAKTLNKLDSPKSNG